MAVVKNGEGWHDGPYHISVGKLIELLIQLPTDDTIAVDAQHLSVIELNDEWYWNSIPKGHINLETETYVPIEQ